MTGQGKHVGTAMDWSNTTNHSEYTVYNTVQKKKKTYKDVQLDGWIDGKKVTQGSAHIKPC